MKRLFSSLPLVALLSGGVALAGGEGWSNDYAASCKQAAEAKKDLLIDFTGSDWCGWCIKLNKEVFSHDEFKAGVKDKVNLTRERVKVAPMPRPVAGIASRVDAGARRLP